MNAVRRIARCALETRRLPQAARAALAVLALGALIMGAAACGGDDEKGSGSTTEASSGESKLIPLDKVPTEPFDPNVKPGAKPPLPNRLAFAMPSSSELMDGMSKVSDEAAKSFGIDYISSNATGDSAKQFSQTEALVSRGISGLILADLAPPALKPVQQKAIEKGVAVFTVATPPSTVEANVDQYRNGYNAAVPAADWIKEHLGGKAKVALFNQDNVPVVKPRAEGMRDALKEAGPGMEIVADVTFKEGNADEGFKLSNTILQRHPDIDLWIGYDGVLVGTVSALKAAGKENDSVLFGLGGEGPALAEIEKGGPYKSTVGWASNVWGYAQAKWTADWREGKSIPLFVQIKLSPLTSPEEVAAFRRDQANPKAAFERNARTHEFFNLLGNTSYEQHRYLTIVGTVPEPAAK